MAQSTAEIEFIDSIAAVSQALWLSNLLDLDLEQQERTKAFVD